MANLVLKLSGSQTSQNIRNAVSFGDKTSARAFLNNLSKAIKDDANAELQILNDDAEAASQTITFSAAATADDTVIVNGVTFTGKASTTANNEFNVGATEITSAANLAAAIRASTTSAVKDFVTASDDGAGVATVTAKNAGTAGNTIPVAEGTDFGGVISVGGAQLEGGSDDTSVSVGFQAW